MPKRPASTLSPGERVLESEASQAPVPLAGKMNGLAGGGLEDLLQVLEAAGAASAGKVRRAVVLHGAVHGAEDPVGHVGGPGNEEKVAAGHARNLGEGNEYRAGAGAPTGSDSERLHWRRRVIFMRRRRRTLHLYYFAPFFTSPERPALPSEPATSPCRAPGRPLRRRPRRRWTRVRPCRVALGRLAARRGPRPWVIALGKAALPMAQAAVETLAARGARAGGRTRRAARSRTGPRIPGSASFAGDHPEPGPGSLAAAEALGAGRCPGRAGATRSGCCSPAAPPACSAHRWRASPRPSSPRSTPCCSAPASTSPR